MSDELTPCPKCGGTNRRATVGDRVRLVDVWCPDCKQVTDYGPIEGVLVELEQLRAERDRYLARYIKTFKALKGMCYQYLGLRDRPDVFDHMCMTAGEQVEDLFFELGVLVEHPGGAFGLAENWREILCAPKGEPQP